MSGGEGNATTTEGMQEGMMRKGLEEPFKQLGSYICLLNTCVSRQASYIRDPRADTGASRGG